MRKVIKINNNKLEIIEIKPNKAVNCESLPNSVGKLPVKSLFGPKTLHYFYFVFFFIIRKKKKKRSNQ